MGIPKVSETLETPTAWATGSTVPPRPTSKLKYIFLVRLTVVDGSKSCRKLLCWIQS